MIWTDDHWIPFRSSNQLAIIPWAQLALRANFVRLLQFRCLFSVTFHFGFLFSLVATFSLMEVFCRKSLEFNRMSWYIWYWPLRGSLKKLQKVGLVGIWTHNHWIPFRCSTQLSYQTISSTATQRQLCRPIPISSFVQCHNWFRLFSFVSRHVDFNQNLL